MHAVSALGDAIAVTRDYLTPVDARQWLKLAVVVVFVSGLMVTPPTTPAAEPSPAPVVDGSTEPMPFENPFSDGELVTLAIAVAALLLGVWLVFTLIGSLLEFVLIEALRSGPVEIRAGVRAHGRKGLSLFAFRIALTVLALAIVAIPAALQLRPIDPSQPIDPIQRASLSTLGGLIVLALVVGLVYWIVMRLTTEFVVPVMLRTDSGVRAGWGRFLQPLRSNVGEYVVYLVLVTLVDFVGAIAVGIVTAAVGFVVAIPFVVLVVVAFFLGPLAIPSLIVLAIVGLVTFLLLTAAIRMPLVVYVRYYALLVLGATDSTLDLIPDRRDTTRSDSGWEEWDDGEDWAGPSSRDSSDSWSATSDETEPDRTDESDESWDTSDDWGYRGDESGRTDERDRDDGWGYRDDDRERDDG
ncbi:hypothetical protein Halru_1061 [Halovivax ruber XH-70]|uniref:Uncharacterized protein n=1 Tax=Halovivax ruber (strain DSM 18193 / JCM 13892 / XH-70) TaxID=797302 RepID=L0IAB8_HALRX|nr:hypothetical protein [Halovivax ruber]AGB15679.1 hypothetical protein Halru_1061 [Halovivax ruber XH-70]